MTHSGRWNGRISLLLMASAVQKDDLKCFVLCDPRGEVSGRNRLIKLMKSPSLSNLVELIRSAPQAENRHGWEVKAEG